MLYHITSEVASRALLQGPYKPDRFAVEGFVHCSHPHQVAAVANRLFRGQTGLVLLEIDPSRLQAPLVEENLEGGAELFPHVYGEIESSAVTRIIPFPCDEAGEFRFPGVERKS